MVIALTTLLGLLDQRKNRVLLLAQAALPEHQFKAFKTLFLDEFGRKGLEGELARIDTESHRHGTDRNGQE